MLLIALQTITLIIAGLMVGNELAVAAFVHPQLRALDDKTHLASTQVLARVYGKVMPFWYIATLVSTIAIAFLLHQPGSLSFKLAATSAVFWLLSILLTLTRLLPVNNQVSNWDLDRLPRHWKALRAQWDRYHTLRLLILAIALICLTIACLI